MRLTNVGWGTDEKAVISILGHRNARQRQEIRKAYETLFHENLIKRIESEISGEFEVPFIYFSLHSIYICTLGFFFHIYNLLQNDSKGELCFPGL